MKRENKDKIEKHKQIIAHHEKTIERIDDGSTSFKLEDQKKAREDAEKMINENLDKIDNIIENDKHE